MGTVIVSPHWKMKVSKCACVCARVCVCAFVRVCVWVGGWVEYLTGKDNSVEIVSVLIRSESDLN